MGGPCLILDRHALIELAQGSAVVFETDQGQVAVVYDDDVVELLDQLRQRAILMSLPTHDTTTH